MQKPSDLINDEILALQIEGAPTLLILTLWGLMKQLAFEELKQSLKL